MYQDNKETAMRTANFRQAVDELKRNGGSRQTMYIMEAWRDRCMTIFGYADSTAEVFEDTHPYMACNSVSEAVATIKKIQSDYDNALNESKLAFSNRQAEVKVESYTIEEWYRNAPRGTYFGD